MAEAARWDIFCAVVDNYGDIGVSFRLARQLVAEHGVRVRLWVDDLRAFRRLRPDVDPACGRQQIQGVNIRAWQEPFPSVAPADVVIEAFACRAPEAYRAAMAAAEPKPVWINLEYLSAEDWVAGCHGLGSLHPSLPLVQYFFFPGFGPDTGGLLRESGLDRQREAFLNAPAARRILLQGLGVQPATDGLTVSLFGYGNEGVGELLDAWAEGPIPVRCLVPESRILAPVARHMEGRAEVGAVLRRGALTVHVVPFLDMDGYDRLLWACDLNFVRGEDSFVRAQWAARPLVWQIYPQAEAVHWKKLEAFLSIYTEDLETLQRDALAGLWRAWNRGHGIGGAWRDWQPLLPAFMDHAARWAGRLQKRPDLASSLVNFCNKQL